jgi:hypothetical protein
MIVYYTEYIAYQIYSNSVDLSLSHREVAAEAAKTLDEQDWFGGLGQGSG